MIKNSHYNIKSVNTYTKEEYPNLPLHGWIKPCINCSTITSNSILFNYNKHTYKFYLCL